MYKYIKELKNNSIYKINHKYGLMEIYSMPFKEKACLFENIYFKNSDSYFTGNLSKTIEYDNDSCYNAKLYELITYENFRY